MPTTEAMSSFYLPLFLLPSLASAFSFNIESTPRQCQDLTISITGSGKPPYTALVIPFGASPFSNNTEVRKIFQQNFTGDATSVSFTLPYPANSQFVAVVRRFSNIIFSMKGVKRSLGAAEPWVDATGCGIFIVRHR